MIILCAIHNFGRHALSGCKDKPVTMRMRMVAGSIYGTVSTDLCCSSGDQLVMPYEMWRVTESQLNLSSLTPLSVAGSGLGVAHRATSVASRIR